MRNILTFRARLVIDNASLPVNSEQEEKTERAAQNYSRNYIFQLHENRFYLFICFTTSTEMKALAIFQLSSLCFIIQRCSLFIIIIEALKLQNLTKRNQKQKLFNYKNKKSVKEKFGIRRKIKLKK